MKDVYLGDGVSVTAATYAYLNGTGGRPPSSEDLALYKQDLALFVSHGIMVKRVSEGWAILNERIIVKPGRVWMSSGAIAQKTYRFKDPAEIVRLVKTGEWKRSEASKDAETRRQSREDAEDRKLRAAFEKEQKALIKSGKPSRIGINVRPHPSSGYYGVAWVENLGQWGVLVYRPTVKGKAPKVAAKRIGFYDSVLEAALAFDVGNIAMRGIFAHTNFPPGSKLEKNPEKSEVVISPDGQVFKAKVDVRDNAAAAGAGEPR